MKKLTLKNYFLINNPEARSVSLEDWLVNQKLHGQESRTRTRFLQLLVPRVKEMDTVRVDMLKKFAEKKKIEVEEDAAPVEGAKPDAKPKKIKVKKDVPIMLDKDGKETTDTSVGKRYKIPPANIPKFNDEYNAYINEEFIIDVTPANRETIYAVRDMLLESEEEFSGRMSVLYDEWCTAFENISEDKDEKEKTAEAEKTESKE